MNHAAEEFRPPPIVTTADGRIDSGSLVEVIQWFLENDQRVAAIRHPNVEALFQWKQEESSRRGEEVFTFSCAEDRLAIGIVQALMMNSSEAALHEWISQLLNALEFASKANEAIAESYKLGTPMGASAVKESEKIPSASSRSEYLNDCWIETLCTAEARVLGWVYQELYGRPFHPNSFQS